ncbi:MAG: hypothetical protein ACREDP_23510, partial [Bradyrhizobium sp.]
MLFAAILIGAGFWASSLHAAQISDEIPLSLQAGRPPQDAWLVVEYELRSETTEINGMKSDALEDELHNIIDRGEARTRVEAFAYLLRYEIAWGYLDLDGDGVNEMLVWLGIPPFCGSAGCQTLLLHQTAAGWQQEFGLYLSEPADSLCYTRNGPDAFPMVRSDSVALWWDGIRQRYVCYRYCMGWSDPDAISEEELSAATPEELSVRKLLHDRP